MSSDRMKTSYRRKLAQRAQVGDLAARGQLSLLPADNVPPPLVHTRGRYVRFSHRYNTWQVRKWAGDTLLWVNISANMARAYAASGLPIGVQG